MKGKKKKFISILLVLSMIFGMSTSVFAGDKTIIPKSSKNEILMSSGEADRDICMKLQIEEYPDEDYIMERTIENGVAKAVVKNKAGVIIASAERSRNKITVLDLDNPNNPKCVAIDVTPCVQSENLLEQYFNKSISTLLSTNSIQWGNWRDGEQTISTHNLAVAALAAALATCCSFTPVSAILSAASVLIASKYEYATIKSSMRYGTDAYFQYAQEKVTIWGRHSKTGQKEHVYGPKTWEQKKSLNA